MTAEYKEAFLVKRLEEAREELKAFPYREEEMPD